MNKIIKGILILTILAGMLACGKGEVKVDTREKIGIQVEDGNRKMVDIEVVKNPERVVVLDYVALDLLVSLGLEEKIVGMVKGSVPPHLREIAKNEDILDLGSLKEIDMEAVMSLEPDVIFTSGRTRSRYDEFSFIAPTVMTSLDYTTGSFESYKKLSMRNAKIFGMEDKVEEIIATHEEKLKKLNELANEKTAIIGMISGGSLKTLGNSSRGSIITREIGFENLALGVDSTHGNSSSYELLLKLDPEYIFIMDRDKVVGKEGASPAKQLMNNEIVHRTKAYKDGKIVYLSSEVWYVSEGGLESMEIMLSDIERAFE